MTDANIFDLRDVIAGLEPDTDTVDVWFDIKGAKALAALETKIADEKDEKEAQKLLDEYQRLLKEFRDKRYTFHLASISKEEKDDIQLKAVEEVPYQRDAFGRDDVISTFKRQSVLQELIFGAYIQKIVNPVGMVQDKPDREVIRLILKRAPEEVANRIDVAIGKLDKAADLKRYSQQDADFLSKP